MLQGGRALVFQFKNAAHPLEVEALLPRVETLKGVLVLYMLSCNEHEGLPSGYLEILVEGL